MVVALTLTRAGEMASSSAIRWRIASRYCPIFGRSQISVTSTLTTPPPACPTSAAACRRNNSDGAPRQRGRWAEVAADVARADRAEERVGQRVQAHVRVGMAEQGLIMRHRHPAQHHLVAVAEPMHVEAEAGASLGPARQQPLAAAKIVFRGHFQIVLVARQQYTRSPACSAIAASSVSDSPAQRRCASRIRPKTKALRRLSPPQTCPLDGGGDGRRPGARRGMGALQRVCRQQRRNGAVPVVERPITRSRMSLLTNGRAASWISTSGHHVDEAFEAIQHRLLARGATRTGASRGRSPTACR